MRNWSLLALLLFATALPNWAYSQVNSLAVPAIPNRAWTASDKPYDDAVQQIRDEYAHGQKMEAIAQKRRSIALANPKDPVAQFAWVCAARGVSRLNNPKSLLPLEILDTLTKADPGNVREYTRYRFCLTEEADRMLPIGNAELIGNRLLASEPKDDWVRTSLVNMLCDIPGGSQPALHYALDGVKKEPKSFKAHVSLGEAYFSRWEASGRKNKAVGNKAISEYQAYLKLAPASDSFHDYALNYIKYIQREMQ